MILYAESSAVLAWLLEEPAGGEIGRLLARAAHVLASDLTLLECERAIIRGVATSQVSKKDGAKWQETLRRISSHWSLVGMGQEVLERARRPFPIEPIRALDALHVATALIVEKRIPGLTILSRDHRVRDNCRLLALKAVP